MPKKLQITCYPEPILRRKAKYIKKFGSELVDLGDQMHKFMIANNGIGLAAPQVGISKKLIVVDLGEDGAPIMLANPKVIWEGENKESYVEGCLSLPDIEGPVVRSTRIRVYGQELENGEEREYEADGLLARCLQHEIDHLNGVLFIDHLSRRDLYDIQSGLRELERVVV